MSSRSGVSTSLLIRHGPSRITCNSKVKPFWRVWPVLSPVEIGVDEAKRYEWATFVELPPWWS
ncbi:hypothetical protein CTA1_13069 [Colletotrichum tanaceti]|uniref:Uncharacterized protein n=1 Tax=Colletotrichum tanaceti TaxID=1306861 RepID=A0A4U6XMQ8_9PEZI|nr:hypothetical protein CTA1_13069 [Colletotrichum tanaceti]